MLKIRKLSVFTSCLENKSTGQVTHVEENKKGWANKLGASTDFKMKEKLIPKDATENVSKYSW